MPPQTPWGSLVAPTSMAWADTWAMGRAELQQAAGLVAIAAGAKQTLPGGLADGGAALGWFSLQYIPRIIPTHCKRLWGRDGLCPLDGISEPAGRFSPQGSKMGEGGCRFIQALLLVPVAGEI